MRGHAAGTRVPAGPDWIHEIKHDGYRLIVQRESKRVRPFNRNGHDWTDRYPLIAEPALRNRSRCRTWWRRGSSWSGRWPTRGGENGKRLCASQCQLVYRSHHSSREVVAESCCPTTAARPVLLLWPQRQRPPVFRLTAPTGFQNTRHEKTLLPGGR
ncbi:hypothetical protein [Bradyrhizobium sp. AUGA SZCCT0274]|uniref:ATP-dependent DNA ligase n=1 Tax=unclassified Bradyrhizobium TaxID=2631580 RepID=UPI003908B46F